MDLEVAEQKTIIEICRRNDVSDCALFGSFARGEATPQSDIDLLIRFAQPKSLLGHIAISQQLQDALGKAIDLVTEQELSDHIKANVRRDLRVLYGERSALLTEHS